ncbi:hypothetical protein [Pedobacter sp. MR2016-24]|uniref:hypothetical protein n=1 Tax=Pedobacter sp. MR2016-24 TaxID=2994466 RepID=UPI002246EAEB|nr:hypothetical protein [Pedobacter sp. MR2016-24]MCX2486089.1 hypothetical protein [Pedobacter sp. MR2016-24]
MRSLFLFILLIKILSLYVSALEWFSTYNHMMPSDFPGFAISRSYNHLDSLGQYPKISIISPLFF